MMNAKLAFAGLCTSLLATTACATQDGGGDDDDTDQPGDAPDADPIPEALVCDGSYLIETQLDVQASTVLPQSIYDGVDILRGLRDEPSATLFELADAAGVPAVGTVRDALPSALESKLDGWIDGYVQQITTGDGPVAVVIDTIVDASETVIAECALTSELTIDGASATHRLREITFVQPDLELRYDLDLAGVPSVIVSATATASVTADDDGTTLAVGGHAFGLPYGELALRALEDTLIARTGADLRGTLGALFDCPALAASVADRCVWGVCVGHEAELTDICEGALDHAAGEIRARFAAARFDALSLHAGSATMLDGDTDGHGDELVDGVWTAEINAGMGPRPAAATFAGSR